ncbi:hypothetical protein A31A_01581 [Escherichia coli KTE156]|nr:hypothetical protein A31A_01581 [Escherichia coli KTE156]EOW62590.1 hypothetical protein A319_00871 [Escherichia coli KTE155]
MPIIDLNQLPAPDVVEELDFETILAERKATLISLYLGALRRNRCGCRTDSFCRLLPA